jgi:hypothetical protein
MRNYILREVYLVGFGDVSITVPKVECCIKPQAGRVIRTD